MSSTATASANPPSSRVQSASKPTAEEKPIENNNATTEKISRPPSASPKPVSDVSVSATTDDGIASDVAAAGSVEPISSERPASANKQATNDTSHPSRPPSAAKTLPQDPVARPPSAAKNATTANAIAESTNTETPASRPSSAHPNGDNLVSHGYTIDTNPRPPSASPKQEQTTGSRPSSATPKVNESTENNPPATSNSRPPSANQQPNQTTTTGSRPPSAAQKANESSTTNSRPPSALKKTDESVLNNSTVATAGSRPSSASQRTDTTKVSENNDTNAPTNARPPSAANARTDSRPPSASQKQATTAAADSTSEQQNTPILFNTDNASITQPIIGRPSSAAKQTPTDESKIRVDVDPVTPIGNSREDLTSSDENKPAETNATTPRIGSASKKPPIN